jgi:quinoprotein glucose dehydrogenase
MNASVQGKSIAAAAGDPSRGKALFEGKGACKSCHRVNGDGSRSGPDLSDAGAALRAIEIETTILDPDARISDNARPFRAVKKDGTVITGILLNQDTFSVQMRDSKGHLASLSKSDLSQFEFLEKSPMPSYRGKLSSQELADLLGYLTSLKGFRAQ